MNKYSVKIINFINKLHNSNDFNLSNNINVHHELIIKIKDIMQKVIKSSSNIKFNKEKFHLDKLHSDDFPKMYLFFREYLNVHKKNCL
jgi:hypothetical protein